MARNTYAGDCRDCRERVEAGAGYFEKAPRGSWPKWSVRCMRCVVFGKVRRGERVATLSLDQRHWWNQLPAEDKRAVFTQPTGGSDA